MKEATQKAEKYIVSNVIGKFEWKGIVIELKQLNPNSRLKGCKFSDVKFKDEVQEKAFLEWVVRQNRIDIQEL